MSSERGSDERPLIIPPNLIEHIPEEKRADFIREYVLHVEHIEQYSGPIPHPNIVANYEQIMPGSVDRILSMAEQRQSSELEMAIQIQGGKAEANMLLLKAHAHREKVGM